jgi:hypothetical protein
VRGVQRAAAGVAGQERKSACEGGVRGTGACSRAADGPVRRCRRLRRACAGLSRSALGGLRASGRVSGSAPKDVVVSKLAVKRSNGYAVQCN